MAGYPRALALVAALGAGLVAGVLFAFSTFVMRALGRLPAAQGIAAMQAVNEAAPAPLVKAALFGTALVSLALGLLALTRMSGPPAAYALVGSALYLAGIVLTVTYHVPRNDALAVLDPSDPGAPAAWTRYVGAWTAWNHVRALTSLAAAASFTVAFGAR